MRRGKLKTIKRKKPTAITSLKEKQAVWKSYCKLFEALGRDFMKENEYCGPHHLAFHVAEFIESEFKKDTSK